MKKTILFLFLPVLLISSSIAQKSEKPFRMDTGFVRFFVGHWSGEGAFANGKKIAADLSFELSLDSCWLLYEHRDRAPNNFKANFYWGVDPKTGQFLAYAFDNFQGHREFAATGWNNGRLVLSTQYYYPRVGMYYEHFIYQKLSDDSFKMTYEASGDGITWQLGDSLIFTRNRS